MNLFGVEDADWSKVKRSGVTEADADSWKDRKPSGEGDFSSGEIRTESEECHLVTVIQSGKQTVVNPICHGLENVQTAMVGPP